MASMTITIPDALVPRVVAAFGVANGAAVKNSLIDYIKGTVRDYEKRASAASAIVASEAQTTADLSTVS